MAATSPVPSPPPGRTSAVDSRSSWSRRDRLGLALCWATGVLLCLVVGTIVIYMAVRGLQYLRPELLVQGPDPAQLDQSKTGGFRDAIYGTLLLVGVGAALAVPLGVCVALWLTEYGRPVWLARLVESGVEVVAGTPSVVLAIFGLALFGQQIFAFLSFEAETGAVFAKSFLTAGAMMALLALPLVVGATREALLAIPNSVREASYSLGKTRAATIRRVLLPASRAGIATGTVLGMGRIAGDTAIVLILAGGSLQLQPAGGLPVFSVLRGNGSSLTAYIFQASPAGEGNAPQKAYAAAFVLLMLVIVLNFIVDLIAQKRKAPAWIR